MEIVTARLRLDALRDEDAPALFAYRGDPAVMRFQGWKPRSADDARRFIEAQHDRTPDMPGTWWQRAIRLRGSGDLIGDLGLHFMDDETVELGISIAPAHQRQGHAREAVEMMFDFVFGGLHKRRVIALVDPRNAPSLRLLESLGMQRRDAQADLAMFELHAENWLAPTDDPDAR